VRGGGGPTLAPGSGGALAPPEGSFGGVGGGGPSVRSSPDCVLFGFGGKGRAGGPFATFGAPGTGGGAAIEGSAPPPERSPRHVAWGHTLASSGTSRWHQRQRGIGESNAKGRNGKATTRSVYWIVRALVSNRAERLRRQSRAGDNVSGTERTRPVLPTTRCTAPATLSSTSPAQRQAGRPYSSRCGPPSYPPSSQTRREGI